VVIRRWIEGQGEEADLSRGEGIGKGRAVKGGNAHPVAQVVEASLPGDHILHVLDDEVAEVVVLEVVAGRGRSEAAIDCPHRHAVVAAGARVGVTVAGGDHVQADRGQLGGAGRKRSGKQQSGSDGGRED